MDRYAVCKVCSSELFLINETFSLVQCNNCDLIFCNKIFTQQQFIDVYDELYNDENNLYQRHSVGEYEEIKAGGKIKIGLKRSKLIKKHINKSSSVVEIGSGIGLVGYYLRQEGIGDKYIGVEIDTEAFNKSQSLGLNTVNADFTYIDELEGTFDIIMLWEVIEHLQDLKTFLKLANKKLNTNGKVILSTPNYDKIYNYPNRKKDQLFQNEPPIHLNFFTKKSIEKVFNLFGFNGEEVTIKKFPYFEMTNARFYINSIKSIFGNYFGSTIYLVAKKR